MQMNFLKNQIKAGCQRQVIASWNYRLLMVTFSQPQLHGTMTVIYPVASSNLNIFLLLVSQTNRHYESMTQFSYHDIMPLHLRLLTGEFLTFQLQAVQDIRQFKYNTDLDLHPSNVNKDTFPPLNHHLLYAKSTILTTTLISEGEAKKKGVIGTSLDLPFQ